MFPNYRAVGLVTASAGALLLAFLCARPALTDDEKEGERRETQRGDAMFDRVDQDGDGAISREEFDPVEVRLKHAIKRMRHNREPHAGPRHSRESHHPVPHHDGNRKTRKSGQHDRHPQAAHRSHGHRGRPTIVHVHHHYYHPGGPPPHHAGPRHGPGPGPHHRKHFHPPAGPHTSQLNPAQLNTPQVNPAWHNHDSSCHCQLCQHEQECHCNCPACREAHCNCEACRDQPSGHHDDHHANATESEFPIEIEFEASDFKGEESTARDAHTTQSTDSTAEVTSANPLGRETLAIITEGDASGNVEIDRAGEPETP
jgi:hypothetical protein